MAAVDLPSRTEPPTDADSDAVEYLFRCGTCERLQAVIRGAALTTSGARGYRG